MTVLEIIAALILLLISTIIILNKQKKTSSKKILTSQAETPKPAKQQPELKPIINDEAAVKPQIQDSAPELKPVDQPSVPVEPAAKPQAPQTTSSESEKNSSLPEDSILRRHYLAHVNSMIESISPARPTESVLSRHHDTMHVAKLEQCLNNKTAMEQLIADYENNKPLINVESVVQPLTTETTASTPENISSCVPEDSILKRHYLTHICSMIEALAPPHPTESVLCRHYETMIVAKLYQCLNSKEAMEKLISDYEHQK